MGNGGEWRTCRSGLCSLSCLPSSSLTLVGFLRAGWALDGSLLGFPCVWWWFPRAGGQPCRLVSPCFSVSFLLLFACSWFHRAVGHGSLSAFLFCLLFVLGERVPSGQCTRTEYSTPSAGVLRLCRLWPCCRCFGPFPLLYHGDKFWALLLRVLISFTQALLIWPGRRLSYHLGQRR